MIKPLFANFFLYFHRKGIIFPSTSHLLRSTRDKNNTTNNNKAQNGTPPLEVAGVPHLIHLAATVNGKLSKSLTHLATNHSSAK